MYKKHSKTYIQHEPKGKKAHNQAKHCPKKRRTRINPYEIVSTPQKIIMGQVEKPTEGHPQKMRPKGLGRGVVAPPLSPLDAKPL